MGDDVRMFGPFFAVSPAMERSGIALFLFAVSKLKRCLEFFSPVPALARISGTSILNLSLILTLSNQFAITQVHAGEDSRCKGLLEKKIGVQEFYGKTPYRLIENPESFRPEDLYLDYSSRDIFIVIVAEHAYLWVNGYRYDGGLLLVGDSGRIRQRDVLTSGTIFRVKNVPQRIFDSIVEKLQTKSKPVALTCSAGVCSFLESNGFTMPSFLRFTPSMLLGHLMRNGIRTEQQEALEYDIMVVGERSLQESIRYGRLAKSLAPVAFYAGMFIFSLANLDLVFMDLPP